MRKKLFSLPTRKQGAKLLQTARTTPWPDLQGRGAPGHLREIRNFGSNPGALRMLMHLPTSSGGEPGLVVVLHGCTQTAEGYDRGAGWSTLADRYGFAVLFPEQARSNNPNGCFNWFNPEDTQRDKGEALSIRQMVGKMIGDHGI